MKRKLASLSLLLCGTFAALPALADSANDTERARQFYSEGKTQYEAKDYLGALAFFEQSYALTQSTALLFDIAQAHRLAGRGHCSASRRYYKSYLELEPNAENSHEVSDRLQEIAACAEAEERQAERPVPVPTPVPVLPAPPLRPSEPVARRGSTPTVAILATGVGGALLLSGGILYLRARQRFDEAKRTCPCPEGSFSDWQKLTDLSYVLLAAGGAGVAAGGAYWLLSVSRDGPHNSSAILAISGKF